jgi:hypothetical protein
VLVITAVFLRGGDGLSTSKSIDKTASPSFLVNNWGVEREMIQYAIVTII